MYNHDHKTQMDNLHSDLDRYGTSGKGSFGGIVEYNNGHNIQMDNQHSDLDRYDTSGVGSFGSIV